MIRIAVLVSGKGQGTNKETPAIQKAQAARINTLIFDSGYWNDEALLKALQDHDVDLVCLAGFMHKLSPRVVSTYRNRIMNIHPALLPKFGGEGMYGRHVHEAVIRARETISGCTVHFVDEEYDTGQIIIQRTVPVQKNDTAETLAARILPEEHKAYVETIRLFAQGRIRIEGRKVRILQTS